MIKSREPKVHETNEEKDHKTNIPPKFTEQQKKTFHDQACEVLDILDKSGNGIYDPDRYPGMYQNQNKNNLPESLKKVFSKQKKQTELTEENVDFKKLFQNE